MTQNSQNPQNYVKTISNTEYEFKFEENHSKLPFSMVFVDLNTCLIESESAGPYKSNYSILTILYNFVDY